MSDEALRRGVYALVALTCVGTAAELVLEEHLEPGPQLVPFLLSALGVLAALWGARRPRPGAKASLAVGVLLVLGGAFGIWEHVEHNYAFDVEIRPTADAATHVWNAVRGGNPLLAPGAYGLCGLLMLLVGWPSR